MAVRFPNMPQAVDPTELDINHFYDNLIDCLNKRRSELLAIAKDNRQEIAAKAAGNARTAEELTQLRNYTIGQLQMNDLHKIKNEILTEIDKKLVEVRTPKPERRVVFRGNSRDLEQIIGDLGDVKEEIPAIPNYENIRKSENIVDKLLNPTGIAVDDISCHIYVAESFPARVSVFSDLGDSLETFLLKEMQYPYGIAVSRNNVYVTDIQLHGVFHYALEGNSLSFRNKLCGRGHREEEFNYPRQLAVSSLSGGVFIADYNNHRIQKLDGPLHHQMAITHETIHRPRDVKLKNDRLYVLTSDQSPCVHVFDSDGLHLIRLAHDSIATSSCWFFCIDEHDNILISDNISKCVRIFSPEGTHLHEIGDFQEGDHESPLGIALSNQSNLVVVTPYDESQLQIFS